MTASGRGKAPAAANGRRSCCDEAGYFVVLPLELPEPSVPELPDVPDVPPVLPEVEPLLPVEPALLPPEEPVPEEPVLPELLLPYCCTHFSRSVPVLPTHWLGVEEAPAALLPEPLVPAEDDPEEPVLPDEPELELGLLEDEPVVLLGLLDDEPVLLGLLEDEPELMLGLLELPDVPELPLVCANAALARKAEKTAALISFNFMDVSCLMDEELRA